MIMHQSHEILQKFVQEKYGSVYVLGIGDLFYFKKSKIILTLHGGE